ncbi:MAG: VOC family protein [Phycisphaeraceae bacterium]|nr:VOC family protein [Phycisphaeraceae bacterium]
MSTGHVTGFHHLAMRSRHFDKALDFYTRLLGRPVRLAWGEKPRRSVMIDVGGCYLEIFERPKSPAPAAVSKRDKDVLLHLALRVDDCVAVLERVRSEGYKVTIEPKDVTIANTAPGSEDPGRNLGWGVTSLPAEVPVRIAFFTGPSGEVIELFQNELS